MSENTFPVYKVDVIVQFYRTEVLTGQESKHFTKNELTPTPKVLFLCRILNSHSTVLLECFAGFKWWQFSIP